MRSARRLSSASSATPLIARISGDWPVSSILRPSLPLYLASSRSTAGVVSSKIWRSDLCTCSVISACPGCSGRMRLPLEFQGLSTSTPSICPSWRTIVGPSRSTVLCGPTSSTASAIVLPNCDSVSSAARAESLPGIRRSVSWICSRALEAVSSAMTNMTAQAPRIHPGRRVAKRPSLLTPTAPLQPSPDGLYLGRGWRRAATDPEGDPELGCGDRRVPRQPRAAIERSIALTSSSDSGSTIGRKRASGPPPGATRNFSKFHMTSPATPSPSVVSTRCW